MLSHDEDAARLNIYGSGLSSSTGGFYGQRSLDYSLSGNPMSLWKTSDMHPENGVSYLERRECKSLQTVRFQQAVEGFHIF